MKPKTQLQHRVYELHKKLPLITDEKLKWGFENCLDMYLFRTKKTLTCFECGHSWETNDGTLITAVVETTCPACNNKLKTVQNNRRRFKDSAYYAIITTIKDMQVVRMFWLEKNYRFGSKANYYHKEVMQHWITSTGKIIRMEIKVNGLSRYVDQWVWNSEMEIKCNAIAYTYSYQRYNTIPWRIYPKKKIIPELKRNGLKGNYYGFAPHIFMSTLLSDSKVETLLKAGQISLMKMCFNSYSVDKVNLYWPTIKICIRNGYIVKDASEYFDYLDMLGHFEKDLRNPKYVCPADLKKEHDRYVRKRNKQLMNEEIESLKESINNDNVDYFERISKFKDIEITKDNITINVIDNVWKVYEEGINMKHCVFTNNYHKIKDIILLSAKVNSMPVETIAYSLLEHKVDQSRGKHNQITEYHNDIINIIESNKHLLLKAL